MHEKRVHVAHDTRIDKCVIYTWQTIPFSSPIEYHNLTRGISLQTCLCFNINRYHTHREDLWVWFRVKRKQCQVFANRVPTYVKHTKHTRTVCKFINPSNGESGAKWHPKLLLCWNIYWSHGYCRSGKRAIMMPFHPLAFSHCPFYGCTITIY